MKLLSFFLISLFLHVNILSAAQAVNLRVVNGVTVPTQSDKWEWILSLRQDGSHICGASLIAPTWVVTASHCIYSYGELAQANSISVMSGSYNVNSNENIVSVKRIIKHPSYNETTVDNDIALIELAQPITNITPIALDRASPLLKDTQSWVAGWGNMSTSGSDYPDNLMEVNLKIIDFNTCNYYYELDGTQLTSNMFCSGYMNGSQDSCQGDSGGPLITAGNNGYALTGVVSFGGSLEQACGAKNYPGVYTKVQNYVDWVQGYTGEFDGVKAEPIVVTDLYSVLLESNGYSIDGKFGSYDFSEVEQAFDWVYESSNGSFYQFRGAASTNDNVFGWRAIEPLYINPSWYMISLGSDLDGDGSTKFDWVLLGVGSRSVYKLAGVNADGTFKYLKLNVEYQLRDGLVYFY